MNFVSIVIPAYNAAATLPDTLSCVIAQSWPHFEAIVIDDGSTDTTHSVIDAFAARDPRVRGVWQANSGVAAARNHGLRISRGNLIAPLDADDLWHPEKLARQIARLERGGAGTGMVYCWSTDVDQSGLIVQHRLALDRWEGDVYAPLVYANFIGNGSVPLIRKNVLLALGGWDTTLRDADAQGCEDWQLYLRIAQHSDVALEPAFLVGYRQGQFAMSRNIHALRRSYQMVLAEARRDRPDLPEWLFRCSKGAFDLYVAELLIEAGDRNGALRAAVRGAWNDPVWLARHSTYHKFQKLIRAARRRLLPFRSPLPPRSNSSFGQLSPQPRAEKPEGRVMSRREAQIDALRRRTVIGRS